MHKEQVEYISRWKPLSIPIRSNEVIETVGQKVIIPLQWKYLGSSPVKGLAQAPTIIKMTTVIKM